MGSFYETEFDIWAGLGLLNSSTIAVLFTKTAAKCTKGQEVSNCGVNSPKKQIFGISALTSKGQTKS